MTSSIKPKIHNISKRRHRRSEPRPRVTCVKICWSSAMRFSSYASGQTDKRTNRHTRHAILRTPPAGRSKCRRICSVQLQCCGVESYTEFAEAAAWKTRLSFTYSVNGTTEMITQHIPQTCCKGIEFETYFSSDHLRCMIAPNSTNANIDTVTDIHHKII